MTVSIIIPVYNSEPWLGRCLDSVIAQSYRDFECICIDDGSVDDSARILAQYAERDSRIRIIRFPENRGVCAARNAGMDSAKGDYVYLMDSDDWIDPDYIEALVRHAHKTGLDIVSNAHFIYEYDDPSKSKPAEAEFVLPGKDAYYSPSVIQRGLLPVIWLRLYKRSFLLENCVSFPRLHGGREDHYFIGLTELLQEKGYVFHGPAYHYYQRAGSLDRSPGNAFRLIQNARLLYDDLVSRGIPTKGACLVYIMPDIDFHSEEEYQFARNFFMDVQDVIRDDEASYPKIVPAFMEVILASPDLASYKERCKPNFYVTYIRGHINALHKS
jgi:glycosyltransferase involved in cell wall biosynthesis